MNADGTGLLRLTDNLVHDLDPSWSPDGRYLSFTTDQLGNSEIYSLALEGLQLTRLTDNPALDFAACWGR